MREDRRETRDDWRDEQRLRNLLARFDEARKNRDEAGLAAVDAELRVLTSHELTEGRAELASDRAEVRAGEQEVRAANREARHEERVGDGVSAAQFRQEARKEERSLRDDVKDLRAEARSYERVRLVRDELRTLEGRRDEGDLNRKRRLIAELVDLAHQEVAQDRVERREDVRNER